MRKKNQNDEPSPAELAYLSQLLEASRPFVLPADNQLLLLALVRKFQKLKITPEKLRDVMTELFHGTNEFL
jgi:hypothetical protein